MNLLAIYVCVVSVALTALLGKLQFQVAKKLGGERFNNSFVQCNTPIGKRSTQKMGYFFLGRWLVLAQREQYREALPYLHKAVALGNAPAEYVLATYMYNEHFDYKRDDLKIMELLLSSSDRSFLPAMEMLAKCYSQGECTSKCEKTGFAWMRKAAEAGSVDAILYVACAYSLGLGVKEDAHQMAYWFERAAIRGDARGIVFFALCLYQGEGIEIDTLRADALLQDFIKSKYCLDKIILRENSDKTFLRKRIIELSSPGNL